MRKKQKGKEKDPIQSKKIFFDRDISDIIKIRLAFWAAYIAELSVAGFSESNSDLYNFARHLSLALEQTFPITLDKDTKQKLIHFANAFFNAETLSGQNHIECYCRKDQRVSLEQLEEITMERPLKTVLKLDNN